MCNMDAGDRFRKDQMHPCRSSRALCTCDPCQSSRTAENLREFDARVLIRPLLSSTQRM